MQASAAPRFASAAFTRLSSLPGGSGIRHSVYVDVFDEVPINDVSSETYAPYRWAGTDSHTEQRDQRICGINNSDVAERQCAPGSRHRFESRLNRFVGF